MKTYRRDFLRLAGLAGAGFLGSWTNDTQIQKSEDRVAHEPERVLKNAGDLPAQQFNMSGYCAPPIETVRIGFIGTGNRGGAAVERISHLEGVQIKCICDIRPEKANDAKARIKSTGHEAVLYTKSDESWMEVCRRDDVDLIYICTPWKLHAPMAVYAMEQGKHVAVEVPAAITVEECWELVKTSEKTRKHCVMLENCCYDFFELLTLNMVRQGLFGEIIHCEGAYIHHVGLLEKNNRYDYWRVKENASRNGNLYPTHGFGPVCQIMNINRGNKLDYLVSMSSGDFMLGELAKEYAAKDDYFKQFVGKPFRGNMNTTTIRTQKGSTIMVQHDVTSPRPYSRIHLVSGTKATAQKYPLPGRIAFDHGDWLSDQEYAKLEEQYAPAIIKKVGDLAKKIGGHGGMDFMMDWRMIDCLRNGLPMDMDVCDAATWSVIGPLSEWSVANRSAAVDIPDFTSGAWKTNTPHDMSLQHGGATGVRSM